jgi:inhibitor of KinA
LQADDVTWEPLGDGAVRVRFGVGIRPEINAHIRRFCRALERDPIPGVIEWVPAYATVVVYYQPWVHRYPEMCVLLQQRFNSSESETLQPARLVEIPVCYGGADGPDLDDVAAFHGLTPAEVIARHTAPTYLVYMLGFAPGFPYLGGLPEGLATPRLDTPRTLVPAGSVGIGGAQTGVYPFATPGGWRILGRTSLVLYDSRRDPPALLRSGDNVRFILETSHAVD